MIARALEQRGIPTVCLSSAYSITRSVGTPRAVYVDYPLGHTAGKPNAPAEQRRITLHALRQLETAQRPGMIRDLGMKWSDDETWKERAFRPSSKSRESRDDRVARFDQPQYQFADEEAQVDSHCPSCVFLTERGARRP